MQAHQADHNSFHAICVDHLCLSVTPFFCWKKLTYCRTTTLATFLSTMLALWKVMETKKNVPIKSTLATHTSPLSLKQHWHLSLSTQLVIRWQTQSPQFEAPCQSSCLGFWFPPHFPNLMDILHAMEPIWFWKQPCRAQNINLGPYVNDGVYASSNNNISCIGGEKIWISGLCHGWEEPCGCSWW